MTASRVPEAVRFWERHRLLYNLALAAIVLAWLAATWPHFLRAVTVPHVAAIVVLAVIANIAYLVDGAVGRFDFHARSRLRITILLLGMLLGVILENYWIADEIYPSIR